MLSKTVSATKLRCTTLAGIAARTAWKSGRFNAIGFIDAFHRHRRGLTLVLHLRQPGERPARKHRDPFVLDPRMRRERLVLDADHELVVDGSALEHPSEHHRADQASAVGGQEAERALNGIAELERDVMLGFGWDRGL